MRRKQKLQQKKTIEMYTLKHTTFGQKYHSCIHTLKKKTLDPLHTQTHPHLA